MATALFSSPVPAALAILAGAAFATPQSAEAAVLSVDFGQAANANSLTETGFQTFNLPASNGTIANPTGTFSGIVVQLNGLGVSSRVRGAIADNPPAFTNNDLLRDFANQLTATASGTPLSTLPTAHTFTITGLAASTSYQIRIWTLDTGFNNGAVSTWYETTVGTGASAALIGSITNSTSPTFPDNNAYSTFGNVTSDASGILRFGQVVQTGVSGGLNGFELLLVPEPSGALLAIGGAAFLAAKRRRRA